MMGRKPKPTALKRLEGNPGKRPLPANEPKHDPLCEACPAELLADAEAALEWARVIVPAIRRGQIGQPHRAMAVAHCAVWSQWRRQMDDAARNPEVVAAGKNKYPIPNPARGMANVSLGRLVQVDAELGLTPASQTKVAVMGQPQDDIEALLSAEPDKPVTKGAWH